MTSEYQPPTPSTGFDISGPGNEELQQSFCEYSQYLIGLAFLSHRSDQDARPCFASGFIMEFDRRWYWITAGHVLREIEECHSIVSEFRLMDSFGFGENKDPVPFDYDGAWKFYEYDEAAGLDFGAVEIAPFYRALLEKNKARVATYREWKRSDYNAFDHFILVGLPSDSIDRTIIREQTSFLVRGKPIPSIVWAEKIEGASTTTYPQLKAAISRNWPVGDIDGMSGGPIFGVRAGHHPMLVAIQCSWLPKRRITSGCPVTVFGPMIEEQLQRR